MGYRGPAPKPTAIRILEGNMSHRPLNGSEPRPRPVAPRCPKYLDPEAKREWKRIVPILMGMRVLTEADSLALGSLCQAYSTMVRAQSKLNESGLLLKTPSGYVQQSPLLGIINACMHTITTLSREFGLTPASRSRIQVQPEDGMDELERALCG